LGTLLVLLENFQCIGFNEGVWICRNPIAFPKTIEFWIIFLVYIQINYQKDGFGRKKWITNSHSGQWQRLHEYIWIKMIHQKQKQNFSQYLGMKSETYLHHKLHGSWFGNNSYVKFSFHRLNWNRHKCHSSTCIVQTLMSCALFRNECHMPFRIF
jgi:hypothetical protein